MKKTRTFVLALALALSTNVALAGEIPGSGHNDPPPCAPNCPGAVQDDPFADFIADLVLALVVRG